MPSTFEIKQLHTHLKAQWSQDSGLSFEEWLVERLAAERLLSEIEHQTVERYEAALNAVLATMPAKVSLPLVIEIKQIVTEALKEAE